MHCFRCGYTWVYTGNADYKVVCPGCKTSVLFEYKYPFKKMRSVMGWFGREVLMI